MHLVKWIGGQTDGRIWYQRHERSMPGIRPRSFEATWVRDMANAHRFPTLELATTTANIWPGKNVEVIEEHVPCSCAATQACDVGACECRSCHNLPVGA